MINNRIEAFNELLERVEMLTDPFKFPKQEKDVIIEEFVSILAPFLSNPDRHKEHVKLIIESSMNIYISSMFSDIFNNVILKFFLGGNNFKKQYFENHNNFIRVVKEKRENLKSSIDPGRIEFDILPIRKIETPEDWKNQKIQLILMEIKTVILPSVGMEPESISQRVEVKNNENIQFVDAFPSSTMEVIGQQEISISDKGKFVSSESIQGKLEAGLSLEIAKLGSSISSLETAQREKETGKIKKTTQSQHISRVISSAVNKTALWQLLRTPTQNLLGENKFLATLIVPADISELEVSLYFSAQIENWGIADKSETINLSIPN